MTVSGWEWFVVAAAAACLLLLLALVLQRVRISRLTARLRDLEHQVEVGASLAAHPKRPGERLVGVVLNVTKESADPAVTLIRAACARAGMPEPLVLATTAADPGRAMTRAALEGGCDVVLAAGGDGTVRAVAAELAGTEAALGVVPLGTGNLFARNIGLPHHSIEECVLEAMHGAPHRVDTVHLTLERAGGRTEQEISLVIAGGGLDAQVMADTRDELKQRAGWLAYGAAGLRHVMGPRKTISVELDGRDPATFRVRSVLLANCGILQAGMVLVPSARFDDGHMDTVLFTPRHALDWARILAKTTLRFTADIPVMKVRQAKSGRIAMAEPMPFQIDGDAVGEVISVQARVDHEALTVNGVVPGTLDRAAADRQSAPAQ